MFERITAEDERGQVGIGTLIVFIAMVLVAAIAAGVLINTAGSLQSQASDTGSETQQAVANQIEVVHAYAETGTPGDPYQDLNLVIKKSAGSDVIDMESATIQYTSEVDSVTLAHETNPDSVAGEEFSTVNATDGTVQSSLTSTEDRLELSIDLDATTGTDPLSPGDSATVAIVDQSGATFTYGVTMPQTVSGNQTVVNV
ncbi:archaellin/type IV pilin N-terminal domain-containing protein [Natronorubrum halophilum]|uniref:archaellin/type IV pilin N-terminal domain-containing protein n=1 Tax=Natronorubrum halophilum TaxID=1702106 RepID=UPI000EF68E58|nr:archaellin/type IV pilin N-terminal domain-containing protein [Natronorubrum halophilum]